MMTLGPHAYLIFPPAQRAGTVSCSDRTSPFPETMQEGFCHLTPTLWHHYIYVDLVPFLASSTCKLRSVSPYNASHLTSLKLLLLTRFSDYV